MNQVTKEFHHSNNTDTNNVMGFTESEKQEAEKALEEINKIAQNDHLNNRKVNNGKSRTLPKINENTSIFKDIDKEKFEHENNLNVDEKEQFEVLMNKLNNAMVDSTNFIQSSTANMSQSQDEYDAKSAKMSQSQNEYDAKSAKIDENKQQSENKKVNMVNQVDDHKGFNDELKWFEDSSDNNNRNKKGEDQSMVTIKFKDIEPTSKMSELDTTKKFIGLNPMIKLKEMDPTKKMITPDSDTLQARPIDMKEKNSELRQTLASEKLQNNIDEHLKLAKENIKEDVLNKERELLNLTTLDQGTGDPLYPPLLANGRAPLQYNETAYFIENNNSTLLKNESVILKNDTLKELDKTFEATANKLLESPLMTKLKAMENYLQEPSKAATTEDPYTTFKRSKLRIEKLKKLDIG